MYKNRFQIRNHIFKYLKLNYNEKMKACYQQKILLKNSIKSISPV